MNLICNDCVGARIYEQLGLQFSNPFMWSLFAYDHFENLIRGYGKMNFTNIEVIFQKYRASCGNSFGIVIDRSVKFFYIHHHEDKACVKPEKRGIDLYVNDAATYLANSYMRRLARMSEQPIFMFHCETAGTEDEIKRFSELITPYRKILLTNDMKHMRFRNANTSVAVIDKTGTTGGAAKEFLTKYKTMLQPGRLFINDGYSSWSTL